MNRLEKSARHQTFIGVGQRGLGKEQPSVAETKDAKRELFTKKKTLKSPESCRAERAQTQATNLQRLPVKSGSIVMVSLAADLQLIGKYQRKQ